MWFLHSFHRCYDYDEPLSGSGLSTAPAHPAIWGQTARHSRVGVLRGRMHTPEFPQNSQERASSESRQRILEAFNQARAADASGRLDEARHRAEETADQLEENPPDERGNSKILSWRATGELQGNLQALGLLDR